MNRVEPDSPNRCQAVTSQGQCMIEVIPNTNLCRVHNRQGKSEKRGALRNYLLGTFYQRAVELGDSDNIKSLRDEVGLSRMILERVLGQVTNESELMVHMGPINDCIGRIEKLVVSCHKLEQSTGSLMDRSALLAFAGQLIEIIADEDIHTDKLTNISNKIVELLHESQG